MAVGSAGVDGNQVDCTNLKIAAWLHWKSQGMLTHRAPGSVYENGSATIGAPLPAISSPVFRWVQIVGCFHRHEPARPRT